MVNMFYPFRLNDRNILNDLANTINNSWISCQARLFTNYDIIAIMDDVITTNDEDIKSYQVSFLVVLSREEK